MSEWHIERIIANTINGDPDALAARIVAALAEAGYRVVPTNGREDAALSPGAWKSNSPSRQSSCL